MLAFEDEKALANLRETLHVDLTPTQADKIRWWRLECDYETADIARQFFRDTTGADPWDEDSDIQHGLPGVLAAGSLLECAAQALIGGWE